MAGFPNSQSNPAAAIPVWIAPAPGAQAKNLASSASTQIKTGAGVFLGLAVNTGQSGATMAVYDGTDSSGKLLGTFSLTTAESLTMPAGGLSYSTGLFVVTTGLTTGNATVSYI